MGDINRQRHQGGGVGAGIAEHQSLVASALVIQGIPSFAEALFFSVVDALGNIWGLFADRNQHPAGVAVEALGRRVIPDFENPLASQLGNLGVGAGSHFTGHYHCAGGHQGFYRYPRRRVLTKDLV